MLESVVSAFNYHNNMHLLAVPQSVCCAISNSRFKFSPSGSKVVAESKQTVYVFVPL